MNYFEQIAGQWRERAKELAAWTMTHLVNRTDVWGRYVHRKSDGTTRAVTAPFRDERGKVFLDHDSLTKHFRNSAPGGQLGVHSAGPDLTSRWLALDIDLHDADDLSVSKERNLSAANGWHALLSEQGLDPLLLDSNGQGGFHLLVVFAMPMSTDSVHQFAARLAADFERRGLEKRPEVFPDEPTWDHYGHWLRLPGRHYHHSHYTRVLNDEPFDDRPWLEGHEAIDRILATRPAEVALLEKLGIHRTPRTVCLDFDGVVHSYRSGWRGPESIPDLPIHGTREAVAKLREHFRVVIYSGRCRTEAGRRAIANGLAQHGIEVDEVCEHKPPALVYVDDRAIAFRGDWEQVLVEIHQFRK